MARWYAVINSSTGQALSYGTEIADPLPAGTTAVVIDHQPGTDEQWDPATRSVVARAPVPDPLQPKRDRLAALRAKGWANLTLVERDEANALRFDLGL